MRRYVRLGASRPSQKNSAVAIGGIIVALIMVSAVWLLPPWLMAGVPTVSGKLAFSDAIKAQNDLRHSIVETLQVVMTAATAAGVVLTLYFTGRNVQLAERAATHAAKTAQDNLDAQRETRIGERFSDAVEQLSNPATGVRVGAIHVLTRLARESREDHWPIVELLCAYLRDRRPAQQTPVTDTVAAPAEDIKAIAGFVRRRHHEHESERTDQVVDLSMINLHGLVFDDAHLQNAILDGAEMEGASFARANLSWARLINTIAKGAVFSESTLENSFAIGADFTDAQMNPVDLTFAQAEKAIFVRAILCGSRLINMIAKRAVFSEADLSGSDLSESDLSGSDLSGADFTDARMNFVDLRGARLENAIFKDVLGPVLNVTEAQKLSAKVWKIIDHPG